VRSIALGADALGATQPGIDAKGARWSAGVTGVSGLEFEGKLMRPRL
jgi:isopentenyl diphosphate isomerase/L-lactate dehydrogenase-like FMN-dependent dehydrogenase